MKLWKYLRRQLTEERGVWQIEKPNTGIVRYKYDKTEDCMRRRMRLKIDKHASKATYLTKDTFEEIKYRKPELVAGNENSTSPTLQLDIGTPSGNMLEQSTVFDASPGITFGQRTLTSLHGDASPILLGRTPLSGIDAGVETTRSHNSARTLDPSSIKNTEAGDEELKCLTKEEVLRKARENEFLLENNISTEEVKLKSKCERITIRGAIWGEVEVTEGHVTFTPLKGDRPDLDEYQLGALKDDFILSRKKKQWSLSNIRWIYVRRYNYVYSAFEIFTADYKAYYFNLYSVKTLAEWMQAFRTLRREIQIISKDTLSDNNNDHQKRWVEGKLSNFDYLMYLNTVASRSYNDLTQYPVFPWIVIDYVSEEIDFNTKDPYEQQKIFRNLSLPIGAQLREKHEDLKDRVNAKQMMQRYGRIEPTNEVEFMYGSHYSAGGHIIDYLVRVEPFTSLQVKLQGGKFDDANRIFSSIPKAGASFLVNRSGQNLRELVPEFFFCPHFLKNK